jgi:hypothetical protein
MQASKIQPEQVYAIKHDDRLVRFYVKAVVTTDHTIACQTGPGHLDLFRSHPSCWSTPGWGRGRQGGPVGVPGNTRRPACQPEGKLRPMLIFFA